MAAGLHVNSVKRLERAETVTGWYALGRVSRVLLDRGAAIPEAWLNWPAAQWAASPRPRSTADIFAECEAKAEAEFQKYLIRASTRACARARHGVLDRTPDRSTEADKDHVPGADQSRDGVSLQSAQERPLQVPRRHEHRTADASRPAANR